MSTQLWTDDYRTNGLDEGYLVRRVYLNQGLRETLTLTDYPAHTNQSGEPRLTGWCGTTNDVAVHAEGIARVTRRAKNGRVRLSPVTDSAEVAAYCDETGFPGLE